MRVFLVKYLGLIILGVLLTACAKHQEQEAVTAGTDTAASTAPPALSPENQKLAAKCQQNSADDCQNLVKNLSAECRHNNAQSCVDIAVLFIKLYEEAVKAKNNDQAVKAYNVAVGSLLKACELKNQTACASLNQLSNHIFGNLIKIKKACSDQKDRASCTVYDEAKKVLTKSCAAGSDQDCRYLRQL